MEKLTIAQVLSCNRTLFKILEQRNTLPASVGFKLYRIMKMFDEVEEYVFDTMDITFENFDFTNMTEEQKLFYNNIISSEIELDFDKIETSILENNENLMLTLEDIDNLSPILN